MNSSESGQLKSKSKKKGATLFSLYGVFSAEIKFRMLKDNGFFNRRKVVKVLKSCDDVFPFEWNVNHSKEILKFAFNNESFKLGGKTHIKCSQSVINYLIDKAKKSNFQNYAMSDHTNPLEELNYCTMLVMEFFNANKPDLLVRLFQKTKYEQIKDGLIEVLRYFSVSHLVSHTGRPSRSQQHNECYFLVVQEIIKPISSETIPHTDGALLYERLNELLFRAFMKNNIELVVAMLNAGAEPNADFPLKGKYSGLNILQFALATKNVKGLIALLDYGLKPVGSDGGTLLDWLKMQCTMKENKFELDKISSSVFIEFETILNQYNVQEFHEVSNLDSASSDTMLRNNGLFNSGHSSPLVFIKPPLLGSPSSPVLTTTDLTLSDDVEVKPKGTNTDYLTVSAILELSDGPRKTVKQGGPAALPPLLKY
jgi:hypothetical protein